MTGLTTLLLLALAADPAPAAAPTFAAEELDFFEKRVRPILVERCFECHSAEAKQVEAGLLLDSREAVLRGGDTSPAAVPGEPAKSLLIEAIGYKSEALQMPPTGKLPDREIQVLEEWVRRGLPYPPAEAKVVKRRTIDLVEGRKHWAFQPVTEQTLPAASPAPVARRVDRFLQARLQEHGLAVSPAADRRVLIRRATFDLVGLPPTIAETAAFASDTAPDAYERLIDRLLASPQHGERWGRTWLDLARYCDVAEAWREGAVAALAVSRLGRRSRSIATCLTTSSCASNWRPICCRGRCRPTTRPWAFSAQPDVLERAEARPQGDQAGRGRRVGRADRGPGGDVPGADRRLRPLPRSQVRSGHAAGLLRPGRRAGQHPPAGSAHHSPPNWPPPPRPPATKAKQLQQQVDKLTKEKEQTDASRSCNWPTCEQQIDELKRTPHYDTPLAPGIADASLEVLPDGQHRTKIEYSGGEAQDVAMHIRGNAANPGPMVPRRFVAVLAADPSRPV